MHRAMTGAGREPDVAGFALHGDRARRAGARPAGRARPARRAEGHRLCRSSKASTGAPTISRFSDLEMTGDAKPGAIVETRAYDDASGRKRLSLATRSDLAIEAQVTAPGATWIDRQLLAKESALSGGGFGAEVREAMDRRSITSSRRAWPAAGPAVIFARDLLNTLRRRDSTRPPPSSPRRRARASPVRRGRARLGRLSPARHARVRPVRHDR
jgi:hypothetical protein